MRLQEILNEDLIWDDADKQVYMSLKGLVNKNKGVFKSQKQQWFVTNKIVAHEADRTPQQTMDFFGVPVEDGQKLVTVEAIAQWAAYGSRSQVPVRWGFVMDDIGVHSFYKIGNKGNMRDGASPEPSKTKLEWSRPKNVNTRHLEKTKAEKKKEFKTKLGMSEGNYLGTEGERMAFELTLVAKKYLDTTQISYNVSAEKWWNMYNDADGNVVYHTGKAGPEKGDKVIGTATVKTHLVNKKGQKVTVVIRPRFKLVEPVEEGVPGSGGYRSGFRSSPKGLSDRPRGAERLRSSKKNGIKVLGWLGQEFNVSITAKNYEDAENKLHNWLDYNSVSKDVDIEINSPNEYTKKYIAKVIF